MLKEEIVRLIYVTVNECVPNKGFTLSHANTLYETVIEGIKKSLMLGNEVRMPGLGKFYTGVQSARTIPNPRIQGQTFEIGERKQIRFKAFRSVREEINSQL